MTVDVEMDGRGPSGALAKPASIAVEAASRFTYASVQNSAPILRMIEVAANGV